MGCDHDMNIYMHNPNDESEIVLYPQAFFCDVNESFKEFYEIFHAQKRLKKFELLENSEGHSLNILAFKSRYN